MITIRRAAWNCGNMAEFRSQNFDNQPYIFLIGSNQDTCFTLFWPTVWPTTSAIFHIYFWPWPKKQERLYFSWPIAVMEFYCAAWSFKTPKPGFGYWHFGLGILNFGVHERLTRMPRFADSCFHPHDLGNYFSNIEYLRAPCHGDLILIISCAMIMGTSLWPITSKIQCWNLTTAALKPCYCHAGTLLLPHWNIATATLEPCYWPCYCHAGT